MQEPCVCSFLPFFHCAQKCATDTLLILSASFVLYAVYYDAIVHGKVSDVMSDMRILLCMLYDYGACCVHARRIKKYLSIHGVHNDYGHYCGDF